MSDATADMCLICRDTLPLAQLCCDVKGSAGVILGGCRHPYCVPCLRDLSPEAYRCALCDSHMYTMRTLYARNVLIVVMAEAGGAGRLWFTVPGHSYASDASAALVDSGGDLRVPGRFLQQLLDALPAWRPPPVCNPKLMQWFRRDVGAQWYPLFEGREDPSDDMWICAEREDSCRFSATRMACAIVGGRWEGDGLRYYGIARAASGQVLVSSNRERWRADGIPIYPPPARMIVAVEEFMYRIGWWSVPEPIAPAGPGAEPEPESSESDSESEHPESESSESESSESE